MGLLNFNFCLKFSFREMFRGAPECEYKMAGIVKLCWKIAELSYIFIAKRCTEKFVLNKVIGN